MLRKKIAAFVVAHMCTGLIAGAQTPMMGWSSWNTYHVNISDTLIMRQADAMASNGLKEAGYNQINIDDGFFGYRDTEGRMHPHPERFPNGLKPVAAHIHSLGFGAGIYSDAGGNTCGSRYDNDPNGFGSGLYGHEEQDAELYFKDWGFDFIKIDYCGAGTELNLDEEKRYREIREAFDRVGCGDVRINLCRWAFPGTWGRDIAGSWRISPDIRPHWTSVRDIIRCNLYLSAYCSPGHYNDMDMLEISRGLTPREEETHFGMWCMMSSPLLIGCDLTKIQPASLKLLTNPELIALNQDSLGLQGRVVARCDGGFVLAKDLEKRHGLKRAVALYNPTDTVVSFSVPLAAVELSGRTSLRDLVKRENLGEVTEEIAFDVDPHGVKILCAEGSRRLEPTVYEAEWGYLRCYDDLGKRKMLVNYVDNPSASGGMIVENLGGRPENTISWDDVWSDKGGEYNLTVTYLPAPRLSLEVEVNGYKQTIKELASEGGLATVTIPVTLKSGYNTVKMGNPYAWAPAIDKIEVKR